MYKRQDQFHAINWVVWFYGNPFVDLTPSAIDNFYTTDGGEYSDAFCEYEGVTASLLPVELINFDANLIDDAVHLDWSTMTEIDNDYFTIEKTKDGFIFEHVATVDGAGNSNVELDYTAIDNNPYAGTSYYRLKQTDFNGDYSYSHLEPITYNPNTINFTVFPNPSSGSDIQVHLSGAGRDEAITFTILDIAGRVVYQVESSADINGRLTTSLKPKDVLAAGMYTVIGKTEVQEYSEKIVVIK